MSSDNGRRDGIVMSVWERIGASVKRSIGETPYGK